MFYAIVPAGGAGTRLWPLSRAARPKFLLDLTGAGRSLLQGTLDRLAPLVTDTLVVTGTAHEAAVREQVPAAETLCEPSPRDSMAAIGLAAAVLAHRHGDVVVGSFAADHVISGDFATPVREAAAAAAAGFVATIGIAPRAPSTAFGYVRAGAGLGLVDAPTARAVVSFVEKPDAATAAAYLADGGYFWNAGMFVARAQVLLGHLAEQRPELALGLREIAAAWDTPQRGAALAAVWPGLEKIAIDHAIAEPVAAAGGVAVVPGRFQWDDVGDMAALATLTHDDDAGQDPLVVAVDAANPVVIGTDRTVAVVGVDDVVVVQTPDALLVTTRAKSQRVKAVVDALRAAGREDLL